MYEYCIRVRVRFEVHSVLKETTSRRKPSAESETGSRLDRWTHDEEMAFQTAMIDVDSRRCANDYGLSRHVSSSDMLAF